MATCANCGQVQDVSWAGVAVCPVCMENPHDQSAGVEPAAPNELASDADRASTPELSVLPTWLDALLRWLRR